jgi:hypothetical protein
MSIIRRKFLRIFRLALPGEVACIHNATLRDARVESCHVKALKMLLGWRFELVKLPCGLLLLLKSKFRAAIGGYFRGLEREL